MVDSSKQDATVSETVSSEVGPAVDRVDVGQTTAAEARAAGVWSQWLHALTCDPEAALAAAEVYRRMNDAERDAWLRALERDVASFDVPAVAVYAPLLAVESSEGRRNLMVRALASCRDSGTRNEVRAFVGGPRHRRVALLSASLYLDFSHVLACGYQIGERFDWVRHDPIVRSSEIPKSGVEVEGVVLQATPVSGLVDELAATILAHERSGLELPDALRLFADWFSPWFEPNKASF